MERARGVLERPPKGAQAAPKKAAGRPSSPPLGGRLRPRKSPTVLPDLAEALLSLKDLRPRAHERARNACGSEPDHP